MKKPNSADSATDHGLHLPRGEGQPNFSTPGVHHPEVTVVNVPRGALLGALRTASSNQRRRLLEALATGQLK